MLLPSVYATKDGGVMVTSNLGKTAEQNIHVHHNTVKHQHQIRLRPAWEYQHYYHGHHQSQVYENYLAYTQWKFVPLAKERQEHNYALQQPMANDQKFYIFVSKCRMSGEFFRSLTGKLA